MPKSEVNLDLFATPLPTSLVAPHEGETTRSVPANCVPGTVRSLPSSGPSDHLLPQPGEGNWVWPEASVPGQADKTNEKAARAAPTPAVRLQLAPLPTAVSKRAVTQLWLGLHLPDWSLTSLHAEIEARQPQVVTVSVGASHYVHAANIAARRAGIEPGMPLNAAYALHGSLKVLARDVRREHTVLEHVAQWAGRFSSRVSLEPPDGVLLEIKGSLRLFGGLHALQRRIAHELSMQHIAAHIAVAPTVDAAICLARHIRCGETIAVRHYEELRAYLANLPLSVLRWPAAVQQLLYAMGIETIGACRRLPRDGLARRIGPSLLTDLDRLYGDVPQVRRNFVPHERFTMCSDLAMDAVSIDHVEQPLESILTQLESFLRARQAAIYALRLTLQSRTQTIVSIVLRFAAPTWQRTQCWLVLKEHLARVTLSEPVVSLRLSSGRLVCRDVQACADKLQLRTDAAAVDRSDAHWAHRSERLLRLIDRLRARLGERSVYGVSPVADHRPERAWRSRHDLELRMQNRVHISAQSFAASQFGKAGRLRRPVWLLEKPQLLKTVHSLPYFHGLMQLEQGPERIESGWWDGHDVARDYYIVRTHAGRRLWVFRDRNPPHGWYLHGVFA